MVTALKRYNGGRVLVFAMGAFAEMSGDVSRICDIIAHDLTRIRICDVITYDQDGHFFFNHPERGGYFAV